MGTATSLGVKIVSRGGHYVTTIKPWSEKGEQLGASVGQDNDLLLIENADIEDVIAALKLVVYGGMSGD